jgi:hypothetical protein
VSMNVAHDLDRVGNDARVVKGSHWIMSSKISVGSTESIGWTLAEVRRGEVGQCKFCRVWRKRSR